MNGQGSRDRVSRGHRDETIDLCDLVAHRTTVRSNQPLEEVYRAFCERDCEFMAVLDGNQVRGVCARRQIGMILGARYGFALFSRKPVSSYMLPETISVRVGDGIEDVLKRVFSRKDEFFYDDVLLLDVDGNFLGHNSAQSLVRLQTSLLMENIEALQEKQRVIRERNEQMVNDLLLAREMQQAMLPEKFPVFPPGVDSASSAVRFELHYAASGVVSGDFFHVMRLDDHRVAVFLCDVMGHGVRAALVTAVLRALLQELSPIANDPGKMMRLLNAELLTILKQAHGVMFASALYLTLDSSSGIMRHACAGHSQPVHLRRSKGTADAGVIPDGISGPALGIFPEARFGTAEARLAEGDALVVYTDGLFEVDDATGEQFGQERLLETMQAGVTLPLSELFSVVRKAVESWGGGKFDDDVCLLGIELARIINPVGVPVHEASGI